MQAGFYRWRQSASFKVAIIGFLVLVLLIPLAMIQGVIEDRAATSEAAAQDIFRTWGGTQFVAGPVVVLPYERRRVSDRGDGVTERDRAYLLPESLAILADLQAEVRYRGLYEVPVYSGDIRFGGRFPALTAENLPVGADDVLWDEVFVAVVVSDARAITATPMLQLGDHGVRFRPGSEPIAGRVAPIAARVGDRLTPAQRGEALDFEFRLALNGADQLQFAPLGDTTTVTMRSAWPSPSFTGSYLPETRDVADDGFEAAWRVSNIGRALPSAWVGRESAGSHLDQAAFGVRLYQPVSLYQLALRAAKYGVLFVGLTFVTWFMFEVVARVRLHPLQYLLIGLANALFYLLLLSLAEHIGFGWSYLLSAAASLAMIVGYSASTLGSRARAGVMAVVLAVLYTLLYLTLNAETYALLAGSIGLWLALGLIMYLTRRIDWYAMASPDGDTGALSRDASRTS